MRVLVTGGSGFVGAPTVRQLTAAGHEVIAPSHRSYDILDALGRAQLISDAKADTLIHLAWETRHAYFWVAPENVQWRDASIDLFRRFLDAGGTRIVMSGSCAEYDWQNASTDPLHETTTPCIPHMPYGDAKLETLHACSEFMDAGASIAWGRLFFLMGPAENPLRLVPAIVRPLLSGKRASMSAGTQIRDFMDVDDAAGAFVALAASNVTGPVNIASGEGLALREIAQYAFDIIANGELGLGDLPMRPVDPPVLLADVDRLTQEVGYTWQYDWKSSIDRCIAYWRTQAPL